MAYTLCLFMKTVILATRYGLDGPGIESRWGREDLQHLSRPALGPTQPPIQCYRVSFPAVKRPGSGVDHPPPSSAEVKESVEFYSLSGSSRPVTGWTLPLAGYLKNKAVTVYKQRSVHNRLLYRLLHKYVNVSSFFLLIYQLLAHTTHVNYIHMVPTACFGGRPPSSGSTTQASIYILCIYVS